MFYKGSKFTAFFGLLLLLSTASTFAQNVLDDIEEEDRDSAAINAELAPNLALEKIKTISPSKKIFILTNENQSFSRGDFISLLVANKLVARALVAKTTTDKISGIKIIKIYNLNLWKDLKPEKEVLILKGDDSYYTNLEKTPTKDQLAQTQKNDSKVQSDEDLFNSTSLPGDEDDLSLDENSKRLIRPDNLISMNVGIIQAQDVDGSKKNYTQLNGTWGYQLADNVWAEAGVGSNTIRDYPFTGLDTRLTNIEVRAKYTISAPLYSYIQPYVGYQTILASSPGAGTDPGDGSRTQAQLDEELQLVQDLKKSTVIFGITVLKRIVPGWFVRADLGTDIINGGLTIEF
jgi:hypothetical protein